MCVFIQILKNIYENLICCNTPVPGQGPVMLSPGIHSFPFKLGLPLGLPSTFLGKHGWVQYFCKAALRETNGLTHKNQQVFIVMNPIDLNLEPNLLAVSFLDGFILELWNSSFEIDYCICIGIRKLRLA